MEEPGTCWQHGSCRVAFAGKIRFEIPLNVEHGWRFENANNFCDMGWIWANMYRGQGGAGGGVGQTGECNCIDADARTTRKNVHSKQLCLCSPFGGQGKMQRKKIPWLNLGSSKI